MAKKFSYKSQKKVNPADYRMPTSMYSTRVSKLKVASIFISLFLVLALIIWPLTNFGKKSFKITFENTDDPLLYEQPVMTNPRFYGVDKNERPYNIVADSAIRQTKDNIALQNINSDMLLQDKSWMTLLSETGDYSTRKNELDLNGSVNLIIDSGYEFFTESAHINLKENMSSGNEAVKVHGPMGILYADGFIIRDGGDNIFFHGNVHLITKP